MPGRIHMGMQWLQKDTGLCLSMSISQKKPKTRLSTFLYILVCTPFLVGIDLNVIFPFTAAISGKCFGLVCLPSSSHSIFVHPFIQVRFDRLVAPLSQRNKKYMFFTVFFVDKPSLAVSTESSICRSIIYCTSCKDYMPIYYFVWLTVITTVCFMIPSCKHILRPLHFQ